MRHHRGIRHKEGALQEKKTVYYAANELCIQIIPRGYIIYNQNLHH